MQWQKTPITRGKREKIAVWLEHDQLKALRALLERDGVPIAEQIRRGVDLWLEKKKK
jgi:Ribbon-helix-helix domain